MCREGLRARLAGTQAGKAGSDPPRPRVLIADHCSSPLALADTVASVVSKPPPPTPKSPPKTRERDGHGRSAAALIRRMVGPAVTPGRCVCACWHWIFTIDDGVHGSWLHGSQGRTDGGGGADGEGCDETTAASAAATSRGAFTHTWTPLRRGGLGALSSPCLTGRGRRSLSREKSAFRPPSSGGKRRGRAVCRQGPSRGGHPADAKGSSLLLSRATICPLTTRGGVGRRDA